MPSIKKHLELCLRRTGKDYKEIHEWIDSRDISHKERAERHDITQIQRYIPIIKEKFGEDGLKEYLQHIKDDYENHIALRMIKKLRRFKFWN